MVQENIKVNAFGRLQMRQAETCIAIYFTWTFIWLTFVFRKHYLKMGVYLSSDEKMSTFKSESNKSNWRYPASVAVPSMPVRSIEARCIFGAVGCTVYDSKLWAAHKMKPAEPGKLYTIQTQETCACASREGWNEPFCSSLHSCRIHMDPTDLDSQSLSQTF